MTTAEVNILSLPYHAQNNFTYLLTNAQAAEAEAGMFVSVPLGAGDKNTLGIIRSVTPQGQVRPGSKYVAYLYTRSYSLSPELMSLCEYIAQTTLSSFGDAVKTAFPTQLLGRPVEYYARTELIPLGLNERIQSLYAFIVDNPNLSFPQICEQLGYSAADGIYYLTSNGYLEKIIKPTAPLKVTYSEYYSVALTRQEAEFLTKSKIILAAFDYISENGESEKQTLREKTRITAAHLRQCVERGIFKVRLVQTYRNPYLSPKKQTQSGAMTEQQRDAYNEIEELYSSGKPAAALLYGVTGSGKTRVIKELCDRVISDGRSVIMLVPEISLTPQSTQIFCSCYGERVAVLHSSLSDAERTDAYRRIKAGEVDMVIGTRSAVFAPLSNLGMIVIDEEQEHTYKSEQTPKYHARDVARFRCAAQNALMLLSSATPSVESYYKAQIGKYRLVRLDSRYGEAGMPQVITADLRCDFSQGRLDPIGTELMERIIETKRKGEQSILFLNRRGYSNFLTCRMCGGVIMCPSCDVSLTYHTKKRFVKNRGDEYSSEFAERSRSGYLMCHYCGHTAAVPEKCPVCGSAHVAYMGSGTQRIADDIAEYNEDIRVLRMDADTTGKKFSYEKILGAFREGQADVLLGTQMVTKGHDFSNVTLVGVILADNALYVQDYHSSERTFSLLTQVIGRAGRGGKPGVAVIQTLNPEHEIIKLAATQDYDKFYRGEIAMRHALSFPPFCDIAVISFSSAAEVALCKYTTEFYSRITQLLETDYGDVRLVLFGPFEAPIYRINNTYRMQMIIKCRLNRRTRALFSALLCEFMKKSISSHIGIDFNPNSLM